jgi:neutral amino acid transport system permease protein
MQHDAVSAAAPAAMPPSGLRVRLGRRPLLVLVVALAAVFLALLAAKGPVATAQTTLHGLVAGSYFALGAIGLTLVYGVLKLVNFAHGDMLTFGAYAALVANATLGLPFVVAVVVAIAATALLGVAFELSLWRPMRRRGASTFQLLLMTIGLALLVRNGIQFFAGSGMASFDIDIYTSIDLGELRIGRMQLIVMLVGFAVLLTTGLMLRYTRFGKQMRALADNFELAEVTGIDTQRIVVLTWLVAAGLAGLAGVLYAASIGVMNPNLGLSLILSLFAAAVLGGVGNAFGALAGGLVIGLSEEWSTLVFNTRWKPGVGFVILILTLILLPQGILGRKRVL